MKPKAKHAIYTSQSQAIAAMVAKRINMIRIMDRIKYGKPAPQTKDEWMKEICDGLLRIGRAHIQREIDSLIGKVK